MINIVCPWLRAWASIKLFPFWITSILNVCSNYCSSIWSLFGLICVIYYYTICQAQLSCEICDREKGSSRDLQTLMGAQQTMWIKLLSSSLPCWTPGGKDICLNLPWMTKMLHVAHYHVVLCMQGMYWESALLKSWMATWFWIQHLYSVVLPLCGALCCTSMSC